VAENEGAAGFVLVELLDALEVDHVILDLSVGIITFEV